MRLTKFTPQLKRSNGKLITDAGTQSIAENSNFTQTTVFCSIHNRKGHRHSDEHSRSVPSFRTQDRCPPPCPKYEIKKRVQITNHLNRMMTIPQHTTIAVFRVLISNQAKNVHSRTNN